MLCVSDIGEALLPIGGCHFESVTICNGLVALCSKALFQDSPVNGGIGAFRKNPQDINNGEEPFLILGIPSAADCFFFKEDDG